MRSTQIVCDECGAVKKDANHWWSVWLYASDSDTFCLSVGPLIPSLSALGRDVCSEECLHRTVSKYLRGEFKNVG